MPHYLIFHLNAPETAELDPASGQFRLAADPASAVATIAGALASHPEAECLAFWDDALGAFPHAGEAFANSLDETPGIPARSWAVPRNWLRSWPGSRRCESIVLTPKPNWQTPSTSDLKKHLSFSCFTSER